jgi:hypothetical protein
MSAPQITQIIVPTAEVKWPEYVEIRLIFDQPLWDLVASVVFEADTRPLTIEGVPTAPQTPVGLGQTPCRATQPRPNEVLFRFQVSPFANGPLQLSDKYWTPRALSARNAWGQKANWGPFLQFDVFKTVTMKPYYSWLQISSPGILYDEVPYPNYPKINKAGVCLGPAGTFSKDINPKMNLKMGTTVGAPAADIVPWNQGKFYAWWNIGALECERGKPIFDFYSEVYQSKRKYSFADFGYEMRNTWSIDQPQPYPDGINTWNYTSAGTEGYIYATCPWIRPTPMPTGGVDWIGRIEWFIMSTESIDMIQGRGSYCCAPPDGWWGNTPSGENDTNLAPWNLAPPRTGEVPENQDWAQALVQVYIAQGWSYLTYQPPTR